VHDTALLYCVVPVKVDKVLTSEFIITKQYVAFLHCTLCFCGPVFPVLHFQWTHCNMMLYCSELMRRALFLQCTEYSSECLFRASVSVCRSRIFKPLLHCHIHNVICRQHSEATVDWTNCMVTSYQTAYFDSVIVEFCWRLNRTELQFWSRRAFQWECLQRRTDWLSTNRPSFAAVNQVATQTRVTYERLAAGQFSSCAVKKRLYSPAIWLHRTTR